MEWCTAKYNCNYGTRNERMGKSNINNPAFSKAILCLDTNEIFPSAKEAYRKYNIHPSALCECLKGRRKTAGKLHWIYYKTE